jgi:hypothetical protein
MAPGGGITGASGVENVAAGVTVVAVASATDADFGVAGGGTDGGVSGSLQPEITTAVKTANNARQYDIYNVYDFRSLQVIQKK